MFVVDLKEKDMKKILTVQIVIWLLFLSGWIQCIYKFCTCDFKPSYKAEIIYGIGVVSGAGFIIGWFDIEGRK